MKIQWSPTSISDLESIREYIAQDSPASTDKIAKRIKEAVNRLKDFPLSGRPGRVFETRELVISDTSFIAAYSNDKEEVMIVSVIHGRQDWPEYF